MKLLSITAQKPHSTGSGTYLTELVKSYDRMGHSQAVVYGIYPDDQVSFPDGVMEFPVVFMPDTQDIGCASGDVSCGTSYRAPDISFPITGMSDIMPYCSTRYRDLTAEMVNEFEEAFIRAVSAAIDSLDPDLIICHHLFLLTALVRKHFPDRKIAGICHGTDLRQMNNCEYLSELVRPYIRELDHIFALHSDQAGRISELFGLGSDLISVIGSGYNDSLFNADGRPSRSDFRNTGFEEEMPVMITYAGKMSRPKGVPELLSVLRRLSCEPDLSPFEVTLAGGCQDSAVMKDLGDLPSCIRWVGQIPQTRLADIFRCSDIFVLPSYFEGLPLVLIEAMASGMVPVSTDLPGVRDWIEENVPDHNIRFIPMPEMASIDEPTEEGRAGFTEDLYETMRQLIIEIGSGDQPLHVPDTTGITWDSVAGRVLGLQQ